MSDYDMTIVRSHYKRIAELEVQLATLQDILRSERDEKYSLEQQLAAYQTHHGVVIDDRELLRQQLAAAEKESDAAGDGWKDCLQDLRLLSIKFDALFEERDSIQAQLAACIRADRITTEENSRLKNELDHVNEELVARQQNHCKDCCCARSWKALGVNSYTGKSIPEHIQEIKAQLAACHREMACTQKRFEDASYLSAERGCDNSELKDQLAACQQERDRLNAELLADVTLSSWAKEHLKEIDRLREELAVARAYTEQACAERDRLHERVIGLEERLRMKDKAEALK